MIFGAHVLLYSPDAEADRGFLRDVLGFPSVDAGRGWLIFTLPPSEVAVHPVEGVAVPRPSGPAMLAASLYLMCDDVAALVASLDTKGVRCTALQKMDWGITTTVRLPSGGELGLYQPLHPTAVDRR
jgi:hypothetical protein